MRFQLGERDYMVEEVLGQWYGPEDSFFNVRTDYGNLYILRRNTSADEWTLECFRQLRRLVGGKRWLAGKDSSDDSSTRASLFRPEESLLRLGASRRAPSRIDFLVGCRVRGRVGGFYLQEEALRSRASFARAGAGMGSRPAITVAQAPKNRGPFQWRLAGDMQGRVAFDRKEAFGCW